MNVIQRAIDGLRHRGEYPEQRRRRRMLGVLDEQTPPEYRSTVMPTIRSTALADQERDRIQANVDKGRTIGSPTRLSDWRERIDNDYICDVGDVSGMDPER